MADVIKCNTGTLSSDEGEVTSNINQIQDSVAKLKELSTKLDNMWDGEASDAFKIRLDGYISNLEEACVSLESVATYERTAVTEYDRCSSDISGMIESIAV